MAPAKKNRPPALLTSDRVKHLAGKSLDHPEEMTLKQIQEMGGSVMRHIIKTEKTPKKRS